MFVFVGMPLYALNALVLPALTQLQATYAHAGETANAIAGVGPNGQ